MITLSNVMISRKPDITNSFLIRCDANDQMPKLMMPKHGFYPMLEGNVVVVVVVVGVGVRVRVVVVVVVVVVVL